jgi:hypothetical protein
MKLKPKCSMLSSYYGLKITQVLIFVFDSESVIVVALYPV